MFLFVFRYFIENSHESWKKKVFAFSIGRSIAVHVQTQTFDTNEYEHKMVGSVDYIFSSVICLK